MDSEQSQLIHAHTRTHTYNTDIKSAFANTWKQNIHMHIKAILKSPERLYHGGNTQKNQNWCSKAAVRRRSDAVAHNSKWELMLTDTMEITEGEQNRMLVRWKSPKCQTAYRLLSPCNLNSQHQSDKLFDRPRVTDACKDNNGLKKKQINKSLIPLTITRQKRGEMRMLWVELVQSAGFSPLNSAPLFWICWSDSSPGSVTGAEQRVHSEVQLR